MSLLGKIDWAKESASAQEYISRIKQSVAEEFTGLDASAKIIDTQYFNHTAIPDFVIQWPGEKQERRVFLRESYNAVVDSDDDEYLSGTDSVLLALNQRGNSRIEHRETVETAPGSRLLVTDTAAVDALPSSTRVQSPVNTLVRANFLRGAKGYVDLERATELASFGQDPNERLSTRSREVIEEHFTRDAVVRIERTANIIQLALDEQFKKDQVEHLGRLSAAEVSALLPWLLEDPQARSNRRFWKLFGQMFSFSDLERMRDAVGQLDLTPLVTANAKTWFARRAAFQVHSLDPDKEEPESKWSFVNGVLGINFNDTRLVLAQKGTSIKARSVEFTPSWARLLPLLEDFSLSGVSLKGIQRSIVLSAEQNPDIRADVEEITQSLGDSYFVDQVTLRAPAPEEGTVDVNVRFDEDIVVAAGDSRLQDLVAMALRLLSYQRELPQVLVDDVLDSMKTDGETLLFDEQ